MKEAFFVESCERGSEQQRDGMIGTAQIPIEIQKIPTTIGTDAPFTKYVVAYETLENIPQTSSKRYPCLVQERVSHFKKFPEWKVILPRRGMFHPPVATRNGTFFFARRARMCNPITPVNTPT